MQITSSHKFQAITRQPKSKAISQTPVAPSLPHDVWVPESTGRKVIKYTAGVAVGGAIGALTGLGQGVLPGLAGTAIGATGGLVAGLIGGGLSMSAFPTDNYGLGNMMLGAGAGALAGTAAGIIAGGLGAGVGQAITLGVLGSAMGLGIAHQI